MNEKQKEFFVKHRAILEERGVLYNGIVLAMYISVGDQRITDDIIQEALSVDVCILLRYYHNKLTYNTILGLLMMYKTNYTNWFERVIDHSLWKVENWYGINQANKLKTTLGLI